MRSVFTTHPVGRAAAAFLVGGLAVLVVHQPVVGLLRALVLRRLRLTAFERPTPGAFRCSCR
jgi:hypothetical protein